MQIKARLTKLVRQATQIKITFSIPLDESEHDFETIEGMKGFLIFQGKPITTEIEEAIKNKFLGVDYEGRTWSQKLRGEIITNWHLNKSTQTMDEFYASKMEEIVDHFRNKNRILKEK